MAMQNNHLAQCFLEALHHGVLETCSLHCHLATLCMVWLPPVWQAPIQAVGAHSWKQLEEGLLLMPSDVHERCSGVTFFLAFQNLSAYLTGPQITANWALPPSAKTWWLLKPSCPSTTSMF